MFQSDLIQPFSTDPTEKQKNNNTRTDVMKQLNKKMEQEWMK